jgi:Uma2 family endonuclease
MSAVASPPQLLTAEQFATAPELGAYTELVKGEVIKVPPPSFVHGKVCFKASFALGMYVVPKDLGHIVTNDSGVVTERQPDSTRGADVAFFSYERLPKNATPRMYPDVVPELVIEVMSPSDRTSQVMSKVGEYLAAGVRVVLVVWPEQATIMAYSEEFFNRSFGGGEDLTLPELFPDFRVPVRSLFE